MIVASSIVVHVSEKLHDGNVMNGSYDLFKQTENGEPVWIETVVGLQNLKKRLMKLSSIKPATYVVYDPVESRFIEPFKKSA